VVASVVQGDAVNCNTGLWSWSPEPKNFKMVELEPEI